jgi:hypothetical protein
VGPRALPPGSVDGNAATQAIPVSAAPVSGTPISGPPVPGFSPISAPPSANLRPPVRPGIPVHGGIPRPLYGSPTRRRDAQQTMPVRNWRPLLIAGAIVLAFVVLVAVATWYGLSHPHGPGAPDPRSTPSGGQAGLHTLGAAIGWLAR